MLATYDAPVDSIKKEEPVTSEFTYLASLPIPQEAAQVELPVHATPLLRHGQSSVSEEMTWRAQKPFMMSVLHRRVDLMVTNQTTYRPNVHRRSKIDPGRR